MLANLQVKNFALIDELEIDFQKGLNILTGETGAGKSIIIGALDMLLGSRANNDVIRKGKEITYIQAVYEPENLKQINEILKEAGIEPDPDILILSREIRRNSRNLSRINGQVVTLNMIKDISQYLVDIHGQHEHQSLLNAAIHLQLLDDFTGKEIKLLKKQIKEIYDEIKEIEKKLNTMEINEAEKARKLDQLEYQINEIDQAALKSDEMEELEQQHQLLTNMEEIFSVTGSICNQINGDDFENTGILDQFGIFMKELEKIKDYDEQLNNFYQELENIFYQLQDLSFQMSNYHQQLEFNQSKLEQIEQRLSIINGLKRKYGKTITDILEYQQQMISRRDELLSQEEKIAQLTARKDKLMDLYFKKARQLSKIRKKYAQELEEQIQEELQDLAMKDTIFKVDFKEKEFSEDGIDNIEFLITTNPGEDLKPLQKIASGGELSRIMLAFKSIIAGIDQVDTLIFDEVDSGVGGKTAQKMAEKLIKISKKRQIICITHLPQIASMADYHFYINKKTDTNHTYTTIDRLDNHRQKEELARMLGGVELTKTTLKHAQEMLEMAENKKAGISN